MDIYKLIRSWFDWCFENPEKINPNHSALYFFCIEHCNRLGWKNKFGLPTTMAKEAIGIRSYNTYINTLNDLIEFGFIIMIEKSRNQYSSNIIALSNFNKAPNKALDKALIKHASKHITKQRESTGESISSIDKQDTTIPFTNKQLNKNTTIGDFQSPDISSSTLENKKEESEYTKCISVYNDFIKKLTGGAGAKIDGQQGKAMKSIINYAKAQQKDKGADVSESLRYIFDNWHILDKYLQGQTTLSAINSKFQDILIQIRNGKSKSTITAEELHAIAERNRLKYGS